MDNLTMIAFTIGLLIGLILGTLIGLFLAGMAYVRREQLKRENDETR